MKFLLLLSLGLLPAFATTKIKEQDQNLTSICRARVKYLGASASRLNFKSRGIQRSSDLVFWNMEILDVSDPKACPEGKDLSLRIRSADFRGNEQNPEIIYPASFTQPKVNDVFSVKARFLEGKDTFSGREYKEWTLVERDDE